MATGTTTVNFGTYPGSNQASAVITGQGAILTSSFIEAWLFPKATADHSEDEHIIEHMDVTVPFSTIVSGTGFTIQVYVPGNYRLYGLFTINWVWV